MVKFIKSLLTKDFAEFINVVFHLKEIRMDFFQVVSVVALLILIIVNFKFKIKNK